MWDVTCPKDAVTKDEIIKILKNNCKKWTFQLEVGESGYEHWQGRFSLKVKQRLLSAKKPWPPEAHLSVTSSANHGNTFYVTKEETRVDGPWSDTDEEIFIPWDVQLMNELKPWQANINEFADIRELRRIHVIVNTEGNIGKTSLCRWLMVHGRGRALPFCNDYRDILRMVCDMPVSKLYLIDMPRAICKEKLFQFWSAIESIKGGYAYDDRYKFRDRIFDPPQVVVFTNSVPDLGLLSADRWDLLTVRDESLQPLNEIEAAMGL